MQQDYQFIYSLFSLIGLRNLFIKIKLYVSIDCELFIKNCRLSAWGCMFFFLVRNCILFSVITVNYAQ